MDLVTKFREKAKARQRKVVLPEYEDKRVCQAADIIRKENIADILILTPESLDQKKQEIYAKEYAEIRKAKGMTIDEARKIMQDPLYYAAMMTRFGDCDGYVAGASHTTPEVARSAIQCLGVNEITNVVSSCFVMCVPDCPYGNDGAFIFADCGIVPDPNPRQLACIAISNAELAKQLFGITPKVAFLSFSTKGSAKAREIDKISEALNLAKQMNPDLIIDGELQVDAAIVPEVAQIKYPGSVLGGEANVLIFPDLEAGNIGYKLVQRLGKARAIGPIIVGLNKPCSDLSRGCIVDDIIDCVAVTSLRAN